MRLTLSIFITVITICTAMPISNDDDSPEARNRKRRPCRGKSAGDGRTFIDWSFQYIDVNYNVNHNINCGGGGGGGSNHGGGGSNHGGGGHGGHGGHGSHGGLGGLLGGLGGGQEGQGGGLLGGNKPQHGGGGLLQGILANRPLAGLFSQSQSQAGAVSGEGLPPFTLPSLPSLPSFSSFPNLGDIFNSFTSLLPSFPQGGFFSPGSSSPVSSGGGNPIITPVTETIITPKPDTQDPDDIIYNDEKPVHGDYDPIVPESYSNLKPGQYLVASNPVFGQFTHDLSDFNPHSLFQTFNKGFDKFVDQFFRR